MGCSVKTGSFGGSKEIDAELSLLYSKEILTESGATSFTLQVKVNNIVAYKPYFILLTSPSDAGPVCIAGSVFINTAYGQDYPTNIVTKYEGRFDNKDGKINFNVSDDPTYGSITIHSNDAPFQPSTKYNLYIYKVL